MTTPDSRPCGTIPPIREAEDMSAAEHRADVTRALPILAAKVQAYASAVRTMTDALAAEPNDPAALRAASDALHDADNAFTEGVLCNVTAVAGWLADAMEREAAGSDTSA